MKGAFLTSRVACAARCLPAQEPEILLDPDRVDLVQISGDEAGSSRAIGAVYVSMRDTFDVPQSAATNEVAYFGDKGIY